MRLTGFGVSHLLAAGVLLAGCATMRHSHCAETTHSPVMRMVCDQRQANTGVCLSSHGEVDQVETCVRRECDDGYTEVSGECVADSSSSPSTPTETRVAKAPSAGGSALGQKLKDCKGWKLSPDSNLAADSLVGETTCSDTVQTWLARAGEPIVVAMGSIYQLGFPSRGVMLDVDSATDVVLDELVYVEASGAYQRYTGPLPYGLTPELSRAQVERIVGKPASTGCIPSVGCFGGYPAKGINQIMYKSDKVDDGAAPMRYISVERKIP